jgi:hypothetical protein
MWTSESRQNAEKDKASQADKEQEGNEMTKHKNKTEKAATRTKPPPRTMVSTLLQHVDRMERPIVIPRSHVLPTVGGTGRTRTILDEVCQRAPDVWILDSGAETVTTAVAEIGLEIQVTMQSDETQYWRDEVDVGALAGV